MAITEEKEIKYALQSGLRACRLSNKALRRLHHRAGELERNLTALIRTLASDAQLYTEEEIPSRYEYPSPYQPNANTSFEEVLADFECRVETLNRYTGCGTKFDKSLLARAYEERPSWVEKLFPVVDWKFLSPTYNESLLKMLRAVASSCGTSFQCNIEIGPDHISQSNRSRKFCERLRERQPHGNILILPAQFGIRHKGRSARRAEEMMSEDEFGLGTFTVATMLLTHPERLVDDESPWICCSEDAYRPFRQSNPMSLESCFYFLCNTLQLGCCSTKETKALYSTPSGFLL